MSTRKLVLLAAAWLALAAVAGVAIRSVHRQRVEHAALRAQATQLAAEAENLRRQRDAATTELAQAEQQLAALPPPKADDPTLTPARRAELATWLARIKQLHRLFDEKPEQRIPEMQFLKDENWLRVAKTANLEDAEDTRKAMSAIRDAATGLFMSQISTAMRKHVEVTKGERPATPHALLAYFDSPIDASILDRYEVTDRSRSLGGPGPNWGVQNKTPIDPDYDSRQHFTSSGSTSSSGLFAWMPELQERYTKAIREYARVNSGDRPKDLAATFPYFNPPLEPEIAQRLLRTERKR